LRTYEALASLTLAVVLISALAATLALTTILDSWYGNEAAQFGVYRTTWFAALLMLLGVNVLCAALIRLPWKQYQTGFVITHLGILVLLAGCFLTRLGHIDAQMHIFEGDRGHRAYEGSHRFDLTVIEPSGKTFYSIPVATGPFNWADYQTKLSFFPWGLAHRDRGVVFDRDGIRLEVLDYYSDSMLEQAKPLRLRVKAEKPKASDPKDGKAGPTDSWQTIDLSLAEDEGAGHGMGRRGRHDLPGGQRIVYWAAANQAEVEAFLDSKPDGAVGPQGRLVVHAGGKKFTFDVEALQASKPIPLPGTDLKLELTAAHNVALQLNCTAPGEEPVTILAVADVPSMNRQDPEHGVYVTYWTKGREGKPADDAAHASVRGASAQRLDILQGPDGKLYYRAWNSPEVEGIGPLASDGTEFVVFRGSDAALRGLVDRTEPSDRPGFVIRPLPFNKGKEGRRERRARVRLTVDDRAEEFWLDEAPMIRFVSMPEPEYRRVVAGQGRRVSVAFERDAFDVGFDVLLHQFNRGLDPGTSMASHYSSLVDVLPRSLDGAVQSEQVEPLGKGVLINLNEPKTVMDPATGRSYRMFQESFGGPWRPGDREFDARVPPASKRDQLYYSTLTLNYDPGRGLKYLGSLLMVCGIGVMFWMKAYFFTRRGSA
jgi:hypothetical protein